MNNLIRIGIIASEPAVQIGLRTILSGEGIEIIAETFSASDYRAWLPQTDVLVITGDAASPEEISTIIQSDETVAILWLVAESNDLSNFSRDINPIVRGILSLDSSPEELRTAVLAIDQGLVVISPHFLNRLFSDQKTEQNEKIDAGKLHLDSAQLTGRESQVLHLMAQGLANKQIALTLGISQRTVKFHVSGIFAKMGVASRTEAVRMGVRQGLITL